MASGVYKIENTVSGKAYIGSSCKMKVRWSQHLSSLRMGNHANKDMQRDFDAFGEASFVFSSLAAVPKSELRIYEQKYIDSCPSLYNIYKRVAPDVKAPTHCGKTMGRNGTTASGAQRYRCRECGFTHTDTPNTHGGHRHGAEGGTSPKERMRKSRARRKNQQQEPRES